MYKSIPEEPIRLPKTDYGVVIETTRVTNEISLGGESISLIKRYRCKKMWTVFFSFYSNSVLHGAFRRSSTFYVTELLYSSAM